MTAGASWLGTSLLGSAAGFCLSVATLSPVGKGRFSLQSRYFYGMGAETSFEKVLSFPLESTAVVT